MMLYDVLKASKGLYVNDSFAMLWDKQLGGWKTITGVLPLTFTAKGGTAADWVIEGNNDVGENLFDVNDLEQGAIDPNTGQNTDITRLKRTTNYISLDVGCNYYMTAPNGGIRIFRYTSDKSFVSSYLHTQAKSLELGANIKYIRMAATADSYPNNLMLVKGSSAPDHYIPYQQGVGERTVNLLSFEIPYGSFSEKVRVKAGVYTLQYDTTTTSYRLDISPKINEVADQYAIALGRDYYWSGDCYRRGSNIPGGGTYSIAITVNYECDLQFRMLYAASEGITTESMLVKGSTAPTTYIPYGYQIPLTVSQQGQPDKTVDIYIGDSPLTEGETVSKTSTGQDIELFKGENVVSTTLYNKPDMEIKYK